MRKEGGTKENIIFMLKKIYRPFSYILLIGLFFSCAHMMNSRTGYNNFWDKGIIPYTFDPDITPLQKRRTLRAMQEWHNKTIVRFRTKKKTDKNWIYITDNTDGCSSFIGKIGGEQPVSIDRSGCGYSQILHELGHAIGLIHEHQREDRDKYVDINWKCIEDDLRISDLYYPPSNFIKIPSWVIPQVGKYDMFSIMHYGSHDFSKNEKCLTIKDKKGRIIVDWGYVSVWDARKVNILYERKLLLEQVDGR